MSSGFFRDGRWVDTSMTPQGDGYEPSVQPRNWACFACSEAAGASHYAPVTHPIGEPCPRADKPAPAPVEPCSVADWVSRVCERGTKGCLIHHDAKPVEPGAPAPAAPTSQPASWYVETQAESFIKAEGAPAPAQGGVSQGPPDTRSPEEVREWNRVWKAGYDAANRDAGHPTLTELRQQLAAAIAERDAAIEDTKDYIQMAKEKDAAIHRAEYQQINAEMWHTNWQQTNALLEQARSDLAQARSALEAAEREAFRVGYASGANDQAHFRGGYLNHEAAYAAWQSQASPQGETTKAPQP